MKRKLPQNSDSGLTLRTKMMLLFVAIFVGILVMAGISLFLMNEVRIGGPNYRGIKNNQDALECITLLKSDIFHLHSDVRSFVYDAGQKIIDRTPPDKLVADIAELTEDIDLRFSFLLERVQTPGRRDVINKAYVIWLEYRKTLLNEVVPTARGGNHHRAAGLMTGIQLQRFNNFSTTVATTVDDLRRDITRAEERIATNIRTKIVILLSITAVVIGMIAIFSFFITTSITRPINTCVRFARGVADGNLDAQISLKGGGEAAYLAIAMNSMTENLHRMLSRISSASLVLKAIDSKIEKASRQLVASAQLQETAVNETSGAVETIKESASEVSDGIEKLSLSAAETASSTLEMAASIEEVAMSADRLGESVDQVSSSILEMAASIKEIDTTIVRLLEASSTTASSITEMDASIRQVEKNAMDAAAISEGVKNDAEGGRRAVEEAIAGMQAIRNSSRITAEVIDNLFLRANDIGAILSVIDEVAEQTNLLALNAAIIAAQAGEHGKGFAVVADEIKELAERTSSSTREIATLIHGVQDETSRAVSAINRAEASITEGENLSLRSGAALEKIVSGVQKASIQVREIARATVEQAQGSKSIKEAMENVAEMVELIAHSAREHSGSSDLIAREVENMRDLTIHVRTSTREQSHTSGLIAHATENVTAMTEQIREACHAQVMSSQKISNAVANIQSSTTSSAETVRVMEDAVIDLSKQIVLLDKEMSGFKI